MKLALICGAALILIGNASAQKSQSPNSQIEPLLQAMDRAANAHDTDQFMMAFLQTDALVFVINGRVIHGWKELREQQRRWWLDGHTDVVYTPKSTEFTTLSPEIVAVTRVFTSSRTAPDGKVADSEFAVSMIWQRMPDAWRIVYDHESRRP